MSRDKLTEWWANQIIGIIMGATGAYLIGSFWIVVGILLMIWGNNIQLAIKRVWSIKPNNDSSWIGD